MRANALVVLGSAGVALVYILATINLPSPTVGDPLGPKAFPALLGGALVLGIVMLLLEMRGGRAPEAASNGQLPSTRLSLAVLVGFALWTVLYIALFERLGYVLATVPYLAGLMTVFHPGKHVTNVLTSVLFAIGSYLVFTELLGVRLPQGPVPY